LKNKSKSPVNTEINLSDIKSNLTEFEEYFINKVNDKKDKLEKENIDKKKELNLLTSKKLLKVVYIN
jgi:hypothetical protein